ncbi:hypothetical protein [Xenophilus azovorans]|uniref:hypothetical protein n=1 Tax=Xenophilus azovorans TaxID=151755 RepID=UPI00056F6274|nr:hypothetical protein [Xenophilus azovorans]
MTSLEQLLRSGPGRLAGWLAVALAVLAAGCSTQPREAPPAAASARAAEAAPAPAAARLGTQWGEGRESRVRSVEARRLNPERPDDVLTVGYAGASGVRAAVGRDPQRQLNVPLAQGDVEWSIRDENDRPLPLQQARGGGTLQVAGTEGARYVLVLRNLSDRSYEVVATVDGLDVLSGQPGSLSRAGYVLQPQGLLRIEGFRKSRDEVAAFRFAAPGRAYAANTPAGDARNIGVIGTALFELEVPGQRPPPRIGAGRSRAFPADEPSSFAPPPRYGPSR